MLELTVAAARGDESPTVGLDESEDVADFHAASVPVASDAPAPQDFACNVAVH